MCIDFNNIQTVINNIKTKQINTKIIIYLNNLISISLN